ncbi:zinc-dependent alcohol dehydrogenase family protein [Thalassospira sp. TSL5-1]|uniref:zinc-dependent alcohol dehydrogenase family protein n=1 Tax=Thalassospira sp. TSL5-1 TaxID=1544451 RepID=UPI0009395615|nr:zinc-dependent alcohol dehydrogenase family protein [Thalassospira sp. TSL5-1]OKH89413.1 alcohol dehydrogenase [Thalassospira sp. TSL5-1]
MKNSALWYRQFGDPLDVLGLETTPLKPLESGLVRVEMIAAPINPSDLIPVTGAYHHRISTPQIAGYEGLGTLVEKAADATCPFSVGQRVMPLRTTGTWQNFVDADPALMVAVPDNIPDDIALRGYINPLAAWLMLDLWPVKDKNILVTAAGSSCAGLLTQWALAQGAASVTGIYRSAVRKTGIEELGAHPVDMTNEAALTDAANSADIVFDAVGGDLARQLLAHMPDGSVLVSYGLLSGQLFALPENAVARIKRFHLRDRLETVSPAKWQGWFDQLWPLLHDASLPPIAVFDLADWKNAINFFHQPGRLEKPVLQF